MPDDAQCLARYASARDAEAFATLVDRHAAMVYAACLRVCRDRADAEDAAQNAFLALARHAGAIRSSLPAWLHTVATNAALRLRRRRRHAPLDAAPEPVAAEQGEAWREALPRIDEALAELPDEMRAALVLRHLEGRSQVEIAEELGLSQPTVSRRLAEGVQELRRRLRWSGEAGALALALESSRMAAPQTVIAKLGHISLVGPGAAKPTLMPLLAKVLAALLVLGALGASLWPRPQPIPPGPLAVDPPKVEPAKDDQALRREAVLARHVTITWHLGRLDRMVAILNGELRSQDGEWLMVLPSAAAREESVQVDLAVADVPLRDALDAIAKQTGYRWRAVGGSVLLDHVMEAAAHAQLSAALKDGKAPRDRIAAAAYALAGSGDAEAVADVLRALGDANVLADPAVPVAEREVALLEALGTMPMNLLPWDPAGRPLAALAHEPGIQAAMIAYWSGAMSRRFPLTSLAVALPAMLGQGSWPELVALVEDPTRLAPDLAGDGRLKQVARERIRQAAAWALGELHAKQAVPLLIDLVRRAPMAPTSNAIVGALGRIGDRAAIDVICARTGEWNAWEPYAYEYCALASLDPTALARLLSPSRAVPGATAPDPAKPFASGWWDGYITRPCAEILPQVLAHPAPQGAQWWVRNAMRYGVPRLATEVTVPAVRDRLRRASAPGESAFLLCLLARLGDREALHEAVLRCIGERGRPPWEELSLVVPTLPEAVAIAELTPMLEALDLDHPDACYLACLEPVHGPRLREALRSRTYTGADLGVVARFLANDPASARAWLAPRIGEAAGAALLQDIDDGIPVNEARAAALARSASDEAFADIAIPRLLASPWGSDTAIACLELLEARPVARVSAHLISSLQPTGLEPSAGPPRDFRARLALLVLRWMREAADPIVRAAAAAWIGDHVTVDFRPPCAEAEAELCSRAESDVDEGVRAAAKKVLARGIDDGSLNGYFSAATQSRVLSGALDDRDEMNRIDALARRVAAAIDAPAPAAHSPPPTKSGDF